MSAREKGEGRFHLATELGEVVFEMQVGEHHIEMGFAPEEALRIARRIESRARALQAAPAAAYRSNVIPMRRRQPEGGR